jgi:MFS family permease
VAAARGGILGFAVAGLSIAGLLANDGKSLLIGLGFIGLALLMALVLPWRWAGDLDPAPRPFRGRFGGGMLRLSRVILIILPVVGSYQWMASLPVKAFTLEEMAVAYLIPGGRDATQAPVNLQDGYMWGHLESPWTIPNTLKIFYEAGKNPEMAEQNATQRRTSLQRLRLDYPSFSGRVLWVLGLGLLLPVMRRGQTRAQRLRSLLQIGAILAVLASCWPSVKSDYQERYVVHGTIWLPLLFMGVVAWLSTILVREDTPMRRLGAGAAPVLCAAFLVCWSGNPVSLSHLQQRLDPVAMGGKQEFEIQRWGEENMQPQDWLLDTSWMMQGLLLSGVRTVARPPNAYPPGGAPWPAGSWRFTQPWPEEGTDEGEHYALVNFLAMAPDTFSNSQVPIEELITGPDSDTGKAIVSDARWQEVYRTTDTIVRVYRWVPEHRPPGWPRGRQTM